MLRKGNISAPHVAPVVLLLYNKPDNLIRNKGLDYDYDKRNIYVVIWDTDIP